MNDRNRIAGFACLVLVSISAFVTPCRAGAQGTSSRQPLIGRIRAAYGVDHMRGSTALVAIGRSTRLGVDSSYTLTFTLDGRYLERTDGPLGETTAYDGREFWATDSSGVTRKLELGDEELASMPIWVLTGRWCAKAGPFEIREIEAPKGEGNPTLELREKKGLQRCTVAISSSSSLPVILRYRTSAGDESWRFENYHTTEGRTVPTVITHSTGPLIETYRIDTVSAITLSPSSTFRRPPTGLSDARFDASASPRLESVRAPSGHTLIHPLVNGKDVGWFFLDTGAEAMCITPQAANAAGMSKVGQVVVSGVGGSTTGSFRTGASFKVGPVEVEGLTFLELDLSFLSAAFKQKIAGVCGYDLFARCVISLRPSTGEVEVWDPKLYTLRAGRWRALYLHEKNAAVKCRFEGDREEVFRVDTGAGDTVSFHSPAVKRLNLLEGRETRMSQSGGVGGMVAARQGQIEWFDVGGYRFLQPTVTFSLAESGSFADPYTAGNVGQALLHPFTVVFDYSRKRVAFIKLPEAHVQTGKKQ